MAHRRLDPPRPRSGGRLRAPRRPAVAAPGPALPRALTSPSGLAKTPWAPPGRGEHSVARLVGAPPGYIGYEEGGQLTEAVRRRP
ncbi:AAA family ATPase, partial [Streptomyces humidus]